MNYNEYAYGAHESSYSNAKSKQVLPHRSKTFHSGAGRIVRVLMRPMSLFESGDISLSELFEKEQSIGAICPLTLENIAYLLIRGGWPDSIGLSEKAAEDYVNTITHVNIFNNKNSEKAKAFLRSLARGTSSQTSLNSIIEDTKAEDETNDEKTAAKYKDSLEKIYKVEDILAWTPSLRSKIAIRTKPIRHFVDPSIAASCLGATSTNLIRDFRTFGLLFESLCIRDLRVYAQCLGAKVSHFRNAKGLEADAIEIKLGLDRIEEAAKKLDKN